MKIELGFGLYPLIFIIIFIKRYLAGIVLNDIHTWIGIAITSFFWWIGVSAILFIGLFILAIIIEASK